MGERSIPFGQRYEAHGETFDSVTIREPRMSDLLELGEPFELQRVGNGTSFVVENTATVAAYVRRCIVKPGFDKLALISLSDARKVREGVLSFFDRGDEPSATSPTTSGSAPTS